MKPLNLESLNDSLKDTSLVLTYDESGLALTHPDFKPLQVDFLSGKIQHRAFHNPLSEMVAKACRAKLKPNILDLTAGLGRDAFLLASIGCHVQMVERNPIMHALLLDGLARLNQHQSNIKLSLLYSSSHELKIKQLNEGVMPDVIYIDPMHPERTKSALVKKEMRILRQLVGEDLDKIELINYAFTLGVKRVVIKWPAKAILPIEKKPIACIKGKSTRFDIFQI